jgi:hypothetical protein
LTAPEATAPLSRQTSRRGLRARAQSLRRYDGVLREPAYPAEHEIRRVRQSGEIKWRGKLVHISEALVGEPVGLAEGEDGWRVSYGAGLAGGDQAS